MILNQVGSLGAQPWQLIAASFLSGNWPPNLIVKEKDATMKMEHVLEMVAMFFLFIAVELADATIIDQKFYIEIDSISFSENYDPIAALASYPTARVGERVFGSVIYDDKNIPTNGNYTIQMSEWPDTSPIPDEYQTWQLNYPGLSLWGFILNPLESSQLHFTDGILSGIWALYHADYGQGLEDEYLRGTSVDSWGRYSYNTWIPELDNCLTFESEFHTRGTIHFFPVPEPCTIILMTCGLSGLWLLRLTLKTYFADRFLVAKTAF